MAAPAWPKVNRSRSNWPRVGAATKPTTWLLPAVGPRDHQRRISHHEPSHTGNPPCIAPLAPWHERLVTLVIVIAPVVGLIWAAERFWHHGIGWFDLVLGAVLYLVTGFGLSLGFHRLFTHRSFRARRWLRISLGVAGSMAVEGSLISWVSHHRRHHVYADRAGDPHSPHTCATVPSVACAVWAMPMWVAVLRRPVGSGPLEQRSAGGS